MFEVAIILTAVVAFICCGKNDSMLVILVLAVSAFCANIYPDSLFGGYSYAFDSILFTFSAIICSSRVLAWAFGFAAIYNLATSLAEAALTSPDLILTSEAINRLDSFVIYYEPIMVLLSMSIIAAGFFGGSYTVMDDYERSDNGVGHIHPLEVSK